METQKDELSWLAFRYIANELSESERNDFEDQLGTCQQARTAVAEMVAQTQVLSAAAEDIKVERAHNRQSNWTTIASIGLGSCLALMLIGLASRNLLDSPAVVVDEVIESGSQHAPAELAFAWAEARSQFEDADNLDSDSLAVGFETSHPSEEPASEEGLVAPSWMLAAVAKLDGGFDPDSGMPE